MRIPPLIVVALAGTILVSCNNSALRDPLSPSPGPAARVSRERSSARIVWGMWTVNVSADHTVFDVVPGRSSAMHLNVVRLLEQTVCTDCLSIGNAHLLANGDLTVDVTLKHPFPSLIQFTAFDVRGILIGDSDYTFPLSGRIVAWGDDQLKFLNADGYTALFNPTEFPEDSPGPPALRYIPGKWKIGSDFSATLNPYLAYSEDQPRRIFTAGSVQTRTAVLHLPSGPLKFGYAVDVCWVPVENVVDPLTDFPPEANCLEAYKIKVSLGSIPSQVGSAAQVEVEVFDHQGKETISSVTLEAPDLLSGELPLSFSAGAGEEAYVFAGTLSNDLGASAGEYPLLVRVADTESDPNLGQVQAWQVGIAKVGPKAGWARTWGDTGYTLCDSVTVNKSGDVLVTGGYEGTVDFDPGPGIDEHISNGKGDAFLCQFDANGSFQWALTWGGPDWDNSNCVAVDLGGNVYVTGYFAGTVDFDPGPGVDEHAATGSLDAFLSKFDQNGGFEWALTWGGSGVDGASGQGVAVDPSGDLYVLGFFGGSMDFDPGIGEDIHDSNENGTGGDACLSKFDSNGAFQWALSWGGQQNVFGYDVEAPTSACVYATGSFSGTADFDPGPGEAERTADDWDNVFLTKFSSTGDFLWAGAWGGNNSTGSGIPSKLDCDSHGSIFVGGRFDFTRDFDPGSGVIERTANGSGAFLSKLDSSGGLLWVNTWSGSDPSAGGADCLDVCVDGNGNAWAVGYFAGTADFDPGPGVDECTSYGEWLLPDVFVSRFDSNGLFQWVRTLGNEYGDDGRAVAADQAGNGFVAGYYTGPVDFDPGPDSDIHSASGAFLVKYPPNGYW